MSLQCLFPGCAEILTVNAIDEHVRRHLRLKQFRCHCSFAFYTNDLLQTHFEEADDNGIHCKTAESEDDCYMNALVMRLISDFKSKAQGVSIPQLASNLRAKHHSATLLTPSAASSPRRRRLNSEIDEVVSRKVSRVEVAALTTEYATQISNVVSNKGQTPVRLSSRSPVRNATLTSRPTSKSPARNGLNKSQLQKFPELRADVMVHRVRTDSGSTVEKNQRKSKTTLHDAITALDGGSLIFAQRSAPTIAPELANLPKVTCLLCRDKAEYSVDFNERRAHVANKHILANSSKRKFPEDIRKEYAYLMSECFPDLANEDDVCVVCHGVENPTRYSSESGRIHHVKTCHMTDDYFLPCPLIESSSFCQSFQFKSTEEVNKHCEGVHGVQGYGALKHTKRPAYEAFLFHKRFFNQKCSELKPLYFPIPLASTYSNTVTVSQGDKPNTCATNSEVSDNASTSNTTGSEPMNDFGESSPILKDALELQAETIEPVTISMRDPPENIGVTIKDNSNGEGVPILIKQEVQESRIVANDNTRMVHEKRPDVERERSNYSRSRSYARSPWKIDRRPTPSTRTYPDRSWGGSKSYNHNSNVPNVHRRWNHRRQNYG